MRSWMLLGGAMLLMAAAPETRPGPVATVSFQVMDETDPAEIGEDTVIFINGEQVAHFVLDKLHAAETQTITIPAVARYDYALCGRSTVTTPDGGREQRVVDGGASLTAVNGHVFRALAAADFTIFYLADASEEMPNPPADARHTNACSLPVS